MSNSDLSNSSYHPSWESREFSKEEYKQELDKLANEKSGGYIISDHHSFKRVGLIGYIWQTIKGWFNGEIQTKPIKVNYELLKFLRYGQTHHFFDDPTIKTLITNLQATLPKESPYDKTVTLIKQIASASLTNLKIESEIKTFYANHQSDLSEPALVSLFHRISAPVIPNTALLHYNKGRIHASNGDLKQAIQSFETAIGMEPGKPEYQLALAAHSLAYARELCPKDNFHENQETDPKTLECCNKAINSVKDITADPIFGYDAKQVLAEAYALKCAIKVKQSDFKTALDVLNTAQKTCGQSQDDLLAAVESLIGNPPSLTLTQKQLSEFYLELAKQSVADQTTLGLVKRSIDAHPTYEAHLLAAEVYLAQGQKKEAVEHAKNAQAMALQGDQLAVIELLLYRCGEKIDVADKNAIQRYENILEKYPDDADVHFQLGKLYLQDNQLDKAKTHLEKTLALDPSGIDAHANLGLLFIKHKDFKQALAEYEKAAADNDRSIQ